MKNIKIISLFFVAILLSNCAQYDEELKKIPEFVSLSETIKQKKTFAGFPPMLSWKLLIGANKHDQGPLIIEKEEPGYFAGVSRGLDYALKNDKEPLSVELIEEMRRQSTESVSKKNETFFNQEIGGRGVQFRLVLGSNASKDGLVELEAKLINDPYRSIDLDKKGKKKLHRHAITRSALYPIMENILNKYEKSSKSIRDIVKLCQDLLQLHPFNDANTRTFITLLLQKELSRNGLTPVILHNPKRFGGHSVKELLEDIASSQERFNSYVDNS